MIVVGLLVTACGDDAAPMCDGPTVPTCVDGVALCEIADDPAVACTTPEGRLAYEPFYGFPECSADDEPSCPEGFVLRCLPCPSEMPGACVRARGGTVIIDACG